MRIKLTSHGISNYVFPIVYKKIILTFILIALFPSSAFSSSQCSFVFSKLRTHQSSDLALELSHEVAHRAENELKGTSLKKSSTKGYAILIGTMVGSAALTTYLSAHLPSNLQFASIFLSQITTLGVFVLGSPIWEPISSRFRKWAFGMRSVVEVKNEDHQGQLETTWQRTQEEYSLNAQMSRNVISHFIYAVQQNFYFAHRAMTENNPRYSAEQVAEAAYRMKILFRDIDPKDPSVAAAVKSTFTNHIEVTPEFIQMVWQKINAIDSDSRSSSSRTYYQDVISTWIGQS